MIQKKRGRPKNRANNNDIVPPRNIAKSVKAALGLGNSGPLDKAGGTREFAPSDQQRLIVKLCAACGFTREQIAALINPPAGISLPTLAKHFERELASGRDEVHAVVANTVVSVAMNTDHPKWDRAAFFFLRTQCGWREDAPVLPGGVQAAMEVVDPASMVADAHRAGRLRLTLQIGERPKGRDDDDGGDGSA